jgi:hypothetical protein
VNARFPKSSISDESSLFLPQFHPATPQHCEYFLLLSYSPNVRSSTHLPNPQTRTTVSPQSNLLESVLHQVHPPWLRRVLKAVDDEDDPCRVIPSPVSSCHFHKVLGISWVPTFQDETRWIPTPRVDWESWLDLHYQGGKGKWDFAIGKGKTAQNVSRILGPRKRFGTFLLLCNMMNSHWRCLSFSGCARTSWIIKMFTFAMELEPFSLHIRITGHFRNHGAVGNT